MGPLATADLFRKIILMTDAACDNDYIRIYIDGKASIPDRPAAILQGGTDPVPAMTDSLQTLVACGADCIVMPCNTAHYFLPRLQAQTDIPFLSMLKATATACREKFPGKAAAILATKGTLASIGTAGVSGAGMIMLAMVLETLGIPVAYIGLIVAVDRIFDMGRTCLQTEANRILRLASFLFQTSPPL